jgi:hypothetical protein
VTASGSRSSELVDHGIAPLIRWNLALQRLVGATNASQKPQAHFFDHGGHAFVVTVKSFNNTLDTRISWIGFFPYDSFTHQQNCPLFSLYRLFVWFFYIRTKCGEN